MLDSARHRGQRERRGGHSGKRGKHVERGGARLADGGGGAHRAEDGKHREPGPGPPHSEQAGRHRRHEEHREHPGEQRVLVMGAEVRDRELLDGHRRQVDGDVTDRDDRAAERPADPGRQLGDSERHGAGEQSETAPASHRVQRSLVVTVSDSRRR